MERADGKILATLFLTVVSLLLFQLESRAQAPVYYDDVLLIVNSASDSSEAIAAYFAEARDIGEDRILRLEAPTKETINDTEFEVIRAEIEEQIIERNLLDSINYLVTTKGFPLRVNRPTGDTSNAALRARRASVESELMLILGPLADSIGNTSWFFHDYGFNNRNRPFRRSEQGFFLVTRLDAYTVEDVKRMIDNGGPNRRIEKDSVLFVLDREPGARDASFDQSQVLAAQILQGRGWPVLLNSDTIYVTEQENVLGYASWGSNDRFHRPFAQNARTNNTWSPGALAETFVSTSARSLRPGTTYGQSLIADWLAEGVSGAKGYVFEPFTIALALPHVYLDRYTDPAPGRAYNMAESFAMASRTLSWMEVVLGDPKTSIIAEEPLVPVVSLPDTIFVCEGSPSWLRAEDSSRAIHAWFIGDTTSVFDGETRFDETHPAFLGEGTEYRLSTDGLQSGYVTYVATNVAGVAYAQTWMEVLPPPVPDFTWEGGTVEPNEPVQFTDLTEGPGTREWDFGDNSDRVRGANPEHTFPRNGTFFVRLFVDNGGCEVSKTIPVTVRSTNSVTSELSMESPYRLSSTQSSEILLLTENGSPAIDRALLYDQIGRVVWESGSAEMGRSSIRISLAGLSAGMYILEVRNAKSPAESQPHRQTIFLP